MHRLIAMDLDDTLFDERKDIPPDVIEMLSRLSDGGVHVVLASGRTLETERYFAGKIRGKCSLVSYNGSRIQFEDGTETNRDIDADRVRDIVGYLHGFECFTVSYGDGKIFVEDGRVDISGDVDSQHSELVVKKDLSETAQASPKVVTLANPKTAKEMLPKISARYPELFVTQSGDAVIEIMPKGVDKAYGLEKVCENLGVDRSECVGVGDYLNDIPMLKFVGLPVAVANAHPEVKAIAGMVTEKKMSYGVLEAIGRIFPDV